MSVHASPLVLCNIPIDDLKPDPANPRRISDAELETLTRSIREFGLVDPIIARAKDQTVISGFITFIHVDAEGHSLPHGVNIKAVTPEEIALQEKAKNLPE